MSDGNLEAALAQRWHDQRQAIDPEHDPYCSCWCCCIDCDPDFTSEPNPHFAAAQEAARETS